MHLFFRDIDFRDIDPVPAQTLTRTTALRIGLLFGPTALLLVVLRLLAHAMLSAPGTPSIGSLLLGPAPPLLFILLVTLLLGAWAAQAWRHVHPAWIVSGTVLLGLGLAFWGALLVPPWLSGWLTREAFQVLRGDLLILLTLALSFAILLDMCSGWTRAFLLVLLHTLLPFLLLLPLFELSVIRAMGSPLDGSLLLYAIRHLGELMPVLASEVGLADLGLLFLPFLLTLLPIGVARIPAVRRWVQVPSSKAPPQSWHAALAALPVAALLFLPPATPLPATHRTLSYAGMLQSLVEDRAQELDGVALPTAPLFDTQRLRLVSTDHTRRLNVVLIILESFRSRSTTPYTPDLATTPFLDDLARRSLLIDNLYAVVTYTNKALVPLLAGVYPELSRENIEAEPGALPATGLPHLLHPHGYRSAFFTPAKMSFERKDQILTNLGFDDYFGDAAYSKDGFYETNYFGYEDRVMLAPSLTWVDAVTAQDQPFFLSYLTLTSHHEYHVPPTFPSQPFVEDPQYNAYLNALHYTDGFLQALFEAFERRGLIDETLFIVVGDHGEAFGEHGQRLHGDVLWEEALQTPGLVYNPLLFPEGRRVSGNRSHIDVLPTVADALGYRIEGGVVPGASLLQPVPDNRIVYHSARNGNLALALRQDSLKFFYYNRRQPMQVFDVRNDPFERHDLAAELDPDLLKAVELELLLWRRGVQQMYHTPGQREHFAVR